MKVEFSYSQELIRAPTIPRADWHFYTEATIPFGDLQYQKLTVKVEFENVELASFRKLGLQHFEISTNEWFHEDDERMKVWQGKFSHIQPIRLHALIAAPVFVYRRTLAEAQAEATRIKEKLSDLKALIHTDRPKKETFDI